MGILRLRPRYDVDPGELKLVRVQHFLAEDGKIRLFAGDVQDVDALYSSLKLIAELLRITKEENAAHWKERKAA